VIEGFDRVIALNSSKVDTAMLEIIQNARTEREAPPRWRR
jgi:hypothetical protein